MRRHLTRSGQRLQAVVTAVTFWLVGAVAIAQEPASDSATGRSCGAIGAAFQEMWSMLVTYLPRMLAALAILIVGYLLAKLIAAGVTRLVDSAKLEERCSKLGMAGLGKFSTLLGTLAYALIMLAVIIVFFEVLRLPIITEPLNRMITEITEYLPKLLGAGFILLAAVVVAKILRTVAIRIVKDAKLCKSCQPAQAEGADATQVKHGEAIGNVVYGLVIVFALPAFFQALDLGAIVQPLQEMLGKFLGMLPNILGAIVIVMLGSVLASFVRNLVANLVGATKLESGAAALGIPNLAKVVGTLVYALILIPIVIMGLQTLKLSVITDPAEQMLTTLLEAIPHIFAAVLILSLSFMLAKFVGSLVGTFLAGIGFDSMIAKLGVLPAEQKEAAKKPSDLCGILAMAFIMVAAVMEAADRMGLALVSDLLGELIPFASKVLLGLLVLGIGVALAKMLQTFVDSAAGGENGIAGKIAKYAVLYVTVGLALNTIGVADRIVSMAFGLPLTALTIAAAIAFGIAFGVGGREVAARKLEEWFGAK